jgi:hypothetical protein
MSKEWLAQLSATAAKQGRRTVGFQAQPRAQASAPAVARRPDTSQRGFIGAIIGSIIRWAIIAAAAGAIFVFVLSNQEHLEDPVGEQVLYGIWSLARMAPEVLSEEAAKTIDANAIYAALKPHADLLPFIVPLAAGIAITALFLPTVNAYRRRFALRFFVFLFNLALLYWALQSGWIKLDLTGEQDWIDGQSVSMNALIAWAVLLAFSFAGFRRARSSVPLPAPAAARPGTAQVPTRLAPARVTSASAPSHSAQVIAGRGPAPAIQRTVTGGSWRRPR